VKFIVNTLETFASLDIDTLAYGEDQVKSTAASGGATTATTEQSMLYYIHGKVRGGKNVTSLQSQDVDLREEHRL
jgi:hypothetical protein